MNFNVNIAKAADFIKRHALWVLISIVSAVFLAPRMGEIRTLLLIAVAEAMCIILSGIAVYTYTELDLTEQRNTNDLGLIFLGVHILVGFALLGLYLPQTGMLQ